MPETKSDIIARLQREIHQLQGLRSNLSENVIAPDLGPVNQAFPDDTFPLGVMHELISLPAENAAATTGFVSGILASLMKKDGICLWIGGAKSVFPPALASFAINPDKVIFITLQKESDIFWAIEEALKCSGLAAVVGEIKNMSFTVSRRFQLAVEQSGVSGFILRQNPRNSQPNACATRWAISSAAGIIDDELPGVGHPCWNVELLKNRNGKTGRWKVGWKNKAFTHYFESAPIIREVQKKTG